MGVATHHCHRASTDQTAALLQLGLIMLERSLNRSLRAHTHNRRTGLDWTIGGVIRYRGETDLAVRHTIYAE